jgi:hypothetical protein
MSTIKNNWTSFASRSFEELKARALANLPPEITDLSDSNPAVILVSYGAGLAEHLNYYLDQVAREAYMDSARLPNSVRMLAEQMGYRIKAWLPEKVDVVVTVTESGGTLSISDQTIPRDTLVEFGGRDWYTTRAVDVVIGDNSNTFILPLSQVSDYVSTINAPSPVPNHWSVPLGEKYSDDSLGITVDGSPYTLVDNFGYSSSSSTHYLVRVDTDGVANVIFGDNINASKPSAGAAIEISYRETDGPAARVIAGSIWSIPNSLLTGSNFSLEGTNPLESSGGSYNEGIDLIRLRAMANKRTLGCGTTLADFEDLARSHPGVSQARVKFECGKDFKIHIAPVTGIIASSTTITEVQNFIDSRKQICTFPEVVAAKPF